MVCGRPAAGVNRGRWAPRRYLAVKAGNVAVFLTDAAATAAVERNICAPRVEMLNFRLIQRNGCSRRGLFLGGVAIINFYSRPSASTTGFARELEGVGTGGGAGGFDPG